MAAMREPPLVTVTASASKELLGASDKRVRVRLCLQAKAPALKSSPISVRYIITLGLCYGYYCNRSLCALFPAQTNTALHVQRSIQDRPFADYTGRLKTILHKPERLSRQEATWKSHESARRRAGDVVADSQGDGWGRAGRGYARSAGEKAKSVRGFADWG